MSSANQPSESDRLGEMLGRLDRMIDSAVEAQNCRLAKIEARQHVHQVLLQYLFLEVFRGRLQRFDQLIVPLVAAIGAPGRSPRNELEQELVLNEHLFARQFVNGTRQIIASLTAATGDTDAGGGPG
jgi:hypothetical protein